MPCVPITQEAVRKANALETAISRGTAQRTTVSRACKNTDILHLSEASDGLDPIDHRSWPA